MNEFEQADAAHSEPKLPEIAKGPGFDLSLGQVQVPTGNVNIAPEEGQGKQLAPDVIVPSEEKFKGVSNTIEPDIRAGAKLEGIFAPEDDSFEWADQHEAPDAIAERKDRAVQLARAMDNGTELPQEWEKDIIARSMEGETSSGQAKNVASGIGSGLMDVARHPINKLVKPVGSLLAMPFKALGESFETDKGHASDAGLAYGAESGVLGLGKMASGLVGWGSGTFSDPVEARYNDMKRKQALSQADAASKNWFTQNIADPDLAPASQELGNLMGQTPVFAAGKPVFGLIEKAVGNASKYAVETALPYATGKSIQGISHVVPAALAAKTALAGHPYGALGILAARYGATSDLPFGVGRLGKFFVGAPMKAVDRFGAQIAGTAGSEDVFSAARQAVADEIKAGESNIATLKEQHAGKIPNVDDPNFKYDQLNTTEQKIRKQQDAVNALKIKHESLAKWETLGGYFQRSAQTGLNIAGLTTIPSTAFAGLAGLAAQPADAEAVARESTEGGMAFMAPFSVFGARSARLTALGDSLAREGRTRMSSNDAHADGVSDMSREGRRQIDIANGIFGKAGKSISVLRAKDFADVLEANGQGVQRDARGAPINLQAGFTDAAGNGYIRSDRAAAMGHELTHMIDKVAGNIATDTYKNTLLAAKDPKLAAATKDFFKNYMDAIRKSDPSYDNLTDDAIRSEAAAELGRYILQSTPLENFYGGGTMIDALQQKIGRMTDRLKYGDRIRTVPGLSAPFSSAQLRDVIDAFYQAGSNIKRGEIMDPKTGEPIPFEEPPGMRDDLRKAMQSVNVKGDPDPFIDQAFQHMAENAEPIDLERAFWYAKKAADGKSLDPSDQEISDLVNQKVMAGMDPKDAQMAAAVELHGPRPKPKGIEAQLPKLEQDRGFFSPDFYSPTAKVVEQKMPERAPAKQALALLAGGNKAEVEWSGAKDWVEAHKDGTPVNKQELLKVLNEGLPQIKEKQLGNYGVEKNENGMYDIVNHQGKVMESYIDKNDANAALNSFLGDEPYHDQPSLNLPGGKNYRELLFTLPTTKETFNDLDFDIRPIPEDQWRLHAAGYTHDVFPSKESQGPIFSGNEKQARDYVDKKRAVSWQEDLPRDEVYQGVPEHFGGEKNIAVSARVDDRVDPVNGGKMLFGQELQSDWAQNIRKKGIKPKDIKEQVSNAKDEVNQFIQPWVKDLYVKEVPYDGSMDTASRQVFGRDYRDLYESQKSHVDKHVDGPWYTVVNRKTGETVPNFSITRSRGDANMALHQMKQHGPPGMFDDMTEQQREEFDKINTKRMLLEQSEYKGVPDMPFKGNAWKKLGIRQLIKHAVEEGYDSIGWTTGAQQNARYNLANFIDGIKFYKSDTNIAALGATAENPRPPVISLEIQRKGSKEFEGLGYHKPDQLEAVIGKEMAKRIMESPDKRGTLTGLDLEVGGTGMKGFYDKELVNIANDIGKKYGAKVEDVPIDTPSDGQRHWVVVDHGDNEFGGEFTSEADAQDYAREHNENAAHVDDEVFVERRTSKQPGSQDVHRMEITPSLRDSVKEHGQPMFMPDYHPDAINPEMPAAYRTKDGRMHVGAWHPDAFANLTAQYSAEDLGKMIAKYGMAYKERGFQNNRGDFLTPEQATEVALKRKQMSMSDVKKMMRGKGPDDDPRGLESLALREVEAKRQKAERQQETPWQKAVRTGKEREFLKREGEGDFMPEVNIGLHVNGEEKLTAKDVAQALEAAGPKVTKLTEHRLGNMEPTVVATLSRALTAHEGNAVAEALGQDAIAQHQMAGQGNLFGPRTEKWGADPNIPGSGFNPEHFVTHSGEKLSDVVARDRMPTRTGASGIWDRMTVDPNFNGGNIKEIADELGVPADKRFFEQKPDARQKIIDYFRSRNQAQFSPDWFDPKTMDKGETDRGETEYDTPGGFAPPGTRPWYRGFFLKRPEEGLAEPEPFFNPKTMDRGETDTEDTYHGQRGQFMPDSPAGALNWERRDYGMTPDQLEQFLIFARSVAGHQSSQRAPMIERMLTDLLTTHGGTSPIAALKELNKDPNGIEDLLRRHGFGPYGQNVQFMKHIAENGVPDLATATPEDLRQIPHIGKATADFFKLHTDPDYRHLGKLDTHVLGWLRDFLDKDAPQQSPPAGDLYDKYHGMFADAADEMGIDPQALDMQIWNDRRRGGGMDQFMPDTHPDAIKEAAIKTDNGIILTGITHPYIRWEENPDIAGGIDGFVTNAGEFLNRDEAFARASKIGQITRKQSEQWASNTNEIGPKLEARSFSKVKQFMPDIEKAQSIAYEAHKDQTRKFTGAPYTDHLHDVASLVKDDLKPAAYLHDIFEDTPLRVADLRELGIDEPTIQLVRNLTRRPNEEYSHYIDRVKESQDARDIKIADLWHNLSTLPEDSTLRKRYVGAMNQLIPSDLQISDALKETQRLKFGLARNLPAGTRVGLRIDVPTYNRTGKYAITIHDGSQPKGVGAPIGYDNIAAIDNPVFQANEEAAQQIQQGHPKWPIATVKGDFNPSRTIPDDIGDYAMVGFNPVKHSYYYEKGTEKPVIGGSKAISVGNTVFVKDPVYGNPAGFLYMPDVPEAIDRAAIRRKSDGVQYTGNQNDTHFMIPASNQGLDDYLGPNGHKIYEEGFVDKNNKWYNREQAFDQMKKTGQLPEDHQPEYQGEANVTDLRQSLLKNEADMAKMEGRKPRLLAEDFMANQPQFMPDTPEMAAAQTAENAQQYKEALPLEWKTDKDGNVKMYPVKDKKTKQIIGYEAQPTLQTYNLDEQPLSVQAATGLKDKGERLDAMTDAASDKLVDFYNEVKDNPEAMQAKGWYRELRDKLLHKLGGNEQDLILFTRLLAATSPNTNPGVNFGFTLDVWNKFQKGDYDGIIEKYKQALIDKQQGTLKLKNGKDVISADDFETYINQHQLIPYRDTPRGLKRPGMHSLRVMDTLSDQFDRIKGLKINQFAHNLAQTDLKSTIDLWAARTLHRLLNDGNTDRWRIQPMNEAGIKPSDFAFGQEAFGKAAEKLGLSPDDLQAILWFAEKLHYDKQGWSNYLDKGDFRPLVEAMQPQGNKQFSLPEAPKKRKK